MRKVLGPKFPNTPVSFDFISQFKRSIRKPYRLEPYWLARANTRISLAMLWIRIDRMLQLFVSVFYAFAVQMIIDRSVFQAVSDGLGIHVYCSTAIFAGFYPIVQKPDSKWVNNRATARWRRVNPEKAVGKWNVFKFDGALLIGQYVLFCVISYTEFAQVLVMSQCKGLKKYLITFQITFA